VFILAELTMPELPGGLLCGGIYFAVETGGELEIATADCEVPFLLTELYFSSSSSC